MSLINKLGLCQVYVSHTYSMLLKILHFALYTILYQSSLWKALRILCCNNSLLIWKVISLTAAKYMPLIFSVWLCLVLCC
jgi:hypothetical protein